MSREMFSGNLRNRLHSDEWLIWQDQYEAKENLKYESLFALSNGYLGIRGSHEEGTKITLPYLYINGVFIAVRLNPPAVDGHPASLFDSRSYLLEHIWIDLLDPLIVRC